MRDNINTNRGANGGHRAGSLFADAGDFSGTTAPGGANGDRMVFDAPSTDGSDAGTPVSFDSTTGALGTNAAADKTTTVANAVGPTLTTLVSFNSTDGAYPLAGLLADAAGDLFGTTTEGGNSSPDGTVFEIAKTAGGYATPATLLSFNGAIGGFPRGGLIADAAGDLFGTTEYDGYRWIRGRWHGVRDRPQRLRQYADHIRELQWHQRAIPVFRSDRRRRR
jgi:hypothetical protein